MIETAARCGYSKCRAELPPPGPQGGRRRAFCRDTRWAGGRSCSQMARSERDALEALGLDSGQTSFGLDAERLREHVEAVRGPVVELAAALQAVTIRLAEVESQALTATETANRAAAAAEAERVAAARDAEEATLRADRIERAAAEHVERATAERAEAVDRARAAARQALEATEALGAARERAEEAVAARDAERSRAEQAVQQSAQQADRRVAEADDQHRQAEERARQAELRERDALAARDAEVRRAQELAGERDAVRGALSAELTTARSAADTALAERESATGRLAALDTELADERAARRDAERNLATATARADGEAGRRSAAELDRDRLRAQLDDLVTATVRGSRATDGAGAAITDTP